MLCVDTDNRIGAVPAVIEDIATDNGFEKSEQLENLGIVSYAGANMTAPDAHRRRTRRERGSCRWLAADKKREVGFYALWAASSSSSYSGSLVGSSATQL